jgi:hypothetical protein
MKLLYSSLLILGCWSVCFSQNQVTTKSIRQDTSNGIYFGLRVNTVNLINNSSNTALLQEFHKSITEAPFPSIDKIYSYGYSLETNIYKRTSCDLQLWSTVGFLNLTESYHFDDFGQNEEYIFAGSQQKFAYCSVNVGYDILRFTKRQNRIEVVPYLGFGFRALLQRDLNGFVSYKTGSDYQREDISLTHLESTYNFDKIYLDPVLGIDAQLYGFLLGFRFQYLEKDFFEQTIPPSKMRRDSDKNFAAQISFGFKL